jgi:hypothetical protein
MNKTGRPVTVLIVAGLYILMGAIGFAYHFRELMVFQEHSVWIELVRLLAIVCGTFMLRGRNWARWLALAWMAFHVAISFPELGQVAFHSLFFVAVAWLLFRPEARQYFHEARRPR